SALFLARIRADPPALVLVQREGLRHTPALSRVVQRVDAAVSRRRRHALPEFCLATGSDRLSLPRAPARRRRARRAPQGLELCRGAAHAARYIPAAAAVPGERGGLARLERLLRLVPLDGHGQPMSAALPLPKPALSRAVVHYTLILCVGLVAIALFLV